MNDNMSMVVLQLLFFVRDKIQFKVIATYFSGIHQLPSAGVSTVYALPIVGNLEPRLERSIFPYLLFHQ